MNLHILIKTIFTQCFSCVHHLILESQWHSSILNLKSLQDLKPKVWAKQHCSATGFTSNWPTTVWWLRCYTAFPLIHMFKHSMCGNSSPITESSVCCVCLRSKKSDIPVSVKKWKSRLALKLGELSFGWKMAPTGRRWCTKYCSWLLSHCLSFSVCFPSLLQAETLLLALMRNQAGLLTVWVLMVRTRDGCCPFPLLCLFDCESVWAVSQSPESRLLNYKQKKNCLHMCILLVLLVLKSDFLGCNVKVWGLADRSFSLLYVWVCLN